MKSLYDENFRYTEAAVEIDYEVTEAVKYLFRNSVREGYNPREVSHVMQSAIATLELEEVLNHGDVK